MDDMSRIRPPCALPRILERTAELGFSMASEPGTGALLRALAASKPGGRLLELGTGTGVATAWLLDGMDGEATLVSVDVDAGVQRVAQEAFSGDRRLELVTEDALHFLDRQERLSFDLVFADAMPGKYERLDKALGVVKPGGFYMVDDMLLQPNWPDDHAPKVPILIEALAARRDFHIVPVAWASGIVVAARRRG